MPQENDGYEWTQRGGRHYWRVAGSGDQWTVWDGDGLGDETTADLNLLEDDYSGSFSNTSQNSRMPGLVTIVTVVILMLSSAGLGFMGGNVGGGASANSDDNTPELVYGCTYLDAINFDVEANTDDGSCQYDLDGDGSTDLDFVLGCTYPDATNYNASATLDDGSCLDPVPPPPVPGCTYESAMNYAPGADTEDGSCLFDADGDGIADAVEVVGCTNEDATNFDENATDDSGECAYDFDGDGVADSDEIRGCTDPNANNANISATDDDGSCDYDLDDDGVIDSAEVNGCTDPLANNVNWNATDDDGSCDYDLDNDGVNDTDEVPGCTNSTANNYNAAATEDDGSCDYSVVITAAEIVDFWDDPENSTMFYDDTQEAVLFRMLTVAHASALGLPLDLGTNANSTAMEMWMGADPHSEINIQYQSIRLFSDLTIEHMTVSGPNGVNHRNGNAENGAWYFARDETHQFEPVFGDDGDDDSGDGDDDSGDGPRNPCEDFDTAMEQFSESAWTVTSVDGVNTGTAENATLRVETIFAGTPIRAQSFRLEEKGTPWFCQGEFLDPSEYTDLFTIHTDYWPTSVHLIWDEQIEGDEDESGQRIWAANVSDDQIEQVYLSDLEIMIGYNEYDENLEEDVWREVDAMGLDEGSTTHVDDCFSWSISWLDADGDGLTSAGDGYTVTRTDLTVAPNCDTDGEYYNTDFEVKIWDNWIELGEDGMEAGGVNLPGFPLLSALAMLGAAAILAPRRQ